VQRAPPAPDVQAPERRLSRVMPALLASAAVAQAWRDTRGQRRPGPGAAAPAA
jgi:hypothetical protein